MPNQLVMILIQHGHGQLDMHHGQQTVGGAMISNGCRIFLAFLHRNMQELAHKISTFSSSKIALSRTDI